jgi:hypothetical protein
VRVDRAQIAEADDPEAVYNVLASTVHFPFSGLFVAGADF